MDVSSNNVYADGDDDDDDDDDDNGNEYDHGNSNIDGLGGSSTQFSTKLKWN